MTITEAAERLDVARPTLSRLVNGSPTVSPEMALKAGRFFGNGSPGCTYRRASSSGVGSSIPQPWKGAAGAVGLLAPTLREPRPASVYAGVCGAVFALMAASLVAELQWFIDVAMASVGFPVGWFTFRSEVQGAARFLCGAEESSG